MTQELEKLEKELGGRSCESFQWAGLTWDRIELPSKEAAIKVVGYLKDAGYEQPEYDPDDITNQHFVTFLAERSKP